MKLTAKTYTDANMLPVSDAVDLLHAFMTKRAAPHIDPQTSDAASPVVSANGAAAADQTMFLRSGAEEISPSETASVRDCHTSEDGARCRVRTCDFLRVKERRH